jgi:cation:H+ antiporter
MMDSNLILNVILVVVGLVLLCFGGNWLVSGGVNIAKKFGVSPLIIGITIVAMGTSAPELAASLAAGERGEIILGNVIGSNIANIGMVIGISAILIPLVIKRQIIKKEIPIMIGFSLLLIGLSLDGEISQYDGILLVGCMIGFTIYVYKTSTRNHNNNNHNNNNDNNQIQKLSYLKSIGLIGLGVALLATGAILTIDNAVSLATSFGISQRVIALTVIAIGTSLPELITSIIAIRRKHADIGIGNIIGSNIYNILMIIGITTTLSGIHVTKNVFLDYIIMVSFSMLLFTGLRSGKINRTVGIGIACAYVTYLLTSFFFGDSISFGTDGFSMDI